jgi:hypothetical protein
MEVSSKLAPRPLYPQEANPIPTEQVAAEIRTPDRPIRSLVAVPTTCTLSLYNCEPNCTLFNVPYVTACILRGSSYALTASTNTSAVPWLSGCNKGRHLDDSNRSRRSHITEDWSYIGIHVAPPNLS